MKPLAARRRLQNFDIAAYRRRAAQTRGLIAATVAAAVLTLFPAGGALTQTASPSNANAALASWRKLSQSEVDCVDKALRVRDSQVWQLIERGIGSGDASVAAVRAGCRTGTKAPAASAAAENSARSRPVQTSSPAPSQPARAPSREYWSFNDSTLNMVVEGNSRKFFYVQPDPKATASGAQPGDLFLEARFSGQGFVGTVYGVEGQCGRVPYRVDGTVHENNRRLEMQGQRPRVDADCTLVGTVLDALTFVSVDPATAVAAATSAAAPAAAAPSAARPAPAKPAVERAAPAKPAAERAASAMAAANRATVADSATEDAAEFNAAPDKKPLDRAAAVKVAAERAVTASVSDSKVAANEPVEEKASAETVVKVARAEASRAKSMADQARAEAEKAIADAISTVASAKWSEGFVQGLISGMAAIAAAFAAGAITIMLLRRRRQAHSANPA